MKSKKGDISIEFIIFGVITVIALIMLVVLFRDKLYQFFQLFVKSAINNIQGLLQK